MSTIEVAVVVDRNGRTLRWHVPPDRSGGYVPDSRDLWLYLWENRGVVGGVAHTHPWEGAAVASITDRTTWEALEAALGQRYVWPVVTFTDAAYYAWRGPGKLDYFPLDAPTWRVVDIRELRERSKGG